jgi:hypothetical protein
MGRVYEGEGLGVKRVAHSSPALTTARGKPHPSPMKRMTLVIEDDVLEAARSLAEAEGRSLGQVISMLARRGLAPQRQEDLGESFPVFSVSPDAKPLTMEMVRQALEES